MREELRDNQTPEQLSAFEESIGGTVVSHGELSPNFGRDLDERQPEAKYGVYVGDFLWIGNEPVMAISDLGPEERNEYDRLFANFEPVKVPGYGSIEEFVADERPIDPETGHVLMGNINFLGYFQAPESVTGMAHRSKMAWQRLEFLERNLEGIDMSGELESRLRGVTSMQQLDRETQALLLDAYNLMANLVSLNDPDVVLTYEGETSSGAKYSARDYFKR